MLFISILSVRILPKATLQSLSVNLFGTFSYLPAI